MNNIQKVPIIRKMKTDIPKSIIKEIVTYARGYLEMIDDENEQEECVKEISKCLREVLMNYGVEGITEVHKKVMKELGQHGIVEQILTSEEAYILSQYTSA
jgi:hypothetical protein